MIGALATLLVLQLAGEVLTRVLGLPVPGPVLGMALLFAALAIRGRTPEPLAAASRGLLSHLSLLFIPAGVGIIGHLRQLSEEWLPLLVTLVASTALAVVVTSFTLRGLQRLTGRSTAS